MIFCISASCSLPKPFLGQALAAASCRVSGALQMVRSSASSLKNSGSLPKSSSMNCCADIGVPSGCQNVVAIMCWMVRSLPSASFTLIFWPRLPYSGSAVSDTHGLSAGSLGVGTMLRLALRLRLRSARRPIPDR